jgi:hypothetical protein
VNEASKSIKSAYCHLGPKANTVLLSVTEQSV